MTEPWLTKAELATVLKVCTKTVERWQRQGLPFTRIGGVNRYLLSEAIRWHRGEGRPAVVVDLHPTGGRAA